MLYAHYSEVPARLWRWRDFSPAEIASRGDGSLLLVPAALDALQAARGTLSAPVVVASGYRDPLHNARVGGAPRSAHKEGHAFDIALAGHDKDRLVAALRLQGFRGFGLTYRSFVHADMGRQREW